MSAPASPSQERVLRNRRRIPVVIGVVLLLIGGGVLAGRFALTIKPVAVVQSYCTAALKQDYASIYQQLTASVRNQASQDIFVQAEQLADDAAGKVTSCSASPLNIEAGFSDATAHVVIKRATGVTVALSLYIHGNTITRMPDVGVFPLLTLHQFCAALIALDYSTAYNLFAPSITGGLSQARFLQASQLADQSGGVMDTCDASHLHFNSDASIATFEVVTHRRLSGSAYTPSPIQINRQNDDHWLLGNVPSV